MAITLKVEPQDFQSVFNEVMVVLDSDKKAEDKFQYIIELSVNGTHTSTLKVQSNPDGFGVFNLGKHLESFVEGVVDLQDKSTFKRIDSAYTEYSIALKEEYLITGTFTSITDSGGFSTYNFNDNPHFEIGDYITIASVGQPTLDGTQKVTNISFKSVPDCITN